MAKTFSDKAWDSLDLLPPKGGHQFVDWRIRAGWRIQENLLNGSWLLRSPDDKVVVRGTRSEVEGIAETSWASPHSHRAIVVLHGLGRTRSSMRKVVAALRAAGFEVADVNYPSLTRSFRACCEQVEQVVAGLQEDGAQQIHFVGHSLGGLIARQVLSDGFQSASRLVTIATPHNGAIVADRASAILPDKLTVRGCLPAIAGGASEVPVPDVPTAVLAGGNGGRGFNPLLDGDNDGIVTVAETRLKHESLFRQIPSIHTTLMDHPETLGAMLAFLIPS